jgi:tripartite ATP-independent transporter DctM subunit
MVIYALVSGTSVGALFLGGVIPGLLMAVFMMMGVHWVAVKRNMPRDTSVKWADVPSIVMRGLLPLSLPVVLLTGIYTGAFTPTEAAAVAALHALVLAGIVYRALDWKGLFAVTLESARASTVVTLIIASSYLMNYVFTAEGVPQAMALWVDGMGLTQWQFLLLVNVMMLVLGCFLDVSVILLVFVPMLIPAAKMLGVDLVHFGVVAVVNMMIGMIHPPFGMLLFVTNALTGIPLKDMIREGWLFVGILLAALMLFTFVPQIVLWLPQSMGYKTI